MRVQVDLEVCSGHARCEDAAPELFALGDDDQAHVLVDEISEAQRADAEEAVWSCPVRALTLIED